MRVSYRESIKRLETEDLGAMKTFIAQTLFILQDFVKNNRDNVPLEDWEYEKIIHIVKSGALK